MRLCTVCLSDTEVRVFHMLSPHTDAHVHTHIHTYTHCARTHVRKYAYITHIHKHTYDYKGLHQQSYCRQVCKIRVSQRPTYVQGFESGLSLLN